MKSLTTVHHAACHAVVALTLGMLGLVTAGCDDSGPALLINTASSVNTSAIISSSPIVLPPITNVPCSTAVGLDSSFHLIVTAGVSPLTLDSVTIHLIDGTNVGGPSITSPRPQITPPPGTTLIAAGDTRDFALHPSFGCITNTPQSFSATAALIDIHGVTRTAVVGGRVR